MTRLPETNPSPGKMGFKRCAKCGTWRRPDGVKYESPPEGGNDVTVCSDRNFCNLAVLEVDPDP